MIPPRPPRPETDPCSLRTTVPGKLVRYLVSDGDFIESGNAYAEIEVMKMILQLKTNISGTVSLKVARLSLGGGGHFLGGKRVDCIRDLTLFSVVFFGGRKKCSLI